MKTQTKVEARKKIVAHIKRRGHVSDFKVTPVLVMRWWNLLNNAMFDGKLVPPKKIIVKEFRSMHGWCHPMGKKGHVQIGINSEFYDRKTFLAILVHEMIHQWQWTDAAELVHGKDTMVWEKPIADIMNHGKTFWQWKKPVREILDLPLNISY